MVRVWISPEGTVHSTKRDATHLELAARFVRERKYTVFSERGINSESITLVRNGWVRLSDANVEGTREALLKLKEQVINALTSVVVRLGTNKTAWVDIIDDDGNRTAVVSTTLGDLLDDYERYIKRTETLGGFSSELNRFRRRPQVRVRRHRRKA